MSDPRALPAGAHARCHFFPCADAAQWAREAADTIATGLRADLARHGRALLLVSGGNTPAPVFAELAATALPWAQIDIGLVDERVTDDAAGRNDALVRRTLLTGAAQAARFSPLLPAGSRDAAAAARAADARLGGTGLAPSVVVLGMGDDGHTASLFPGSRDLAAVRVETHAYAALDASGCEVAGPYTQRITLTPAGLARARARVLLLRGQDKLAVFERALVVSDPAQMPISLVFDLPGAPLQVHWCP